MERGSLAVGVLVAVLYPAAATAQVTSVKILSYPPSAVPLGQAVTILVEGTNPCGAVTINFGDGQSQTFPLQNGLPFQTTHTYLNPPALPGSTRTLSAKGEANCRSRPVSLSFKIAGGPTPGGSGSTRGGHGQERSPDTRNPGGRGPERRSPGETLAALCQQVDCELAGEPLKQPVIKAGFGKVTPGSFVAILGEGFGLGPGQVLLHMGFPIKASVPLQDLEWSANGIGGVIPSVEGFKDGEPATLQVVTSTQKESNRWKVLFTAEPFWVVLTYKDRGIIKLTCSDESDVDVCNGKTDTNVTLDDLLPHVVEMESMGTLCEPLVCASHTTSWWDVFGADTGTDTYKAQLKNGWIFTMVQRDATVPRLVNIEDSGTGSSAIDITVKWNTGGAGETIRYDVTLIARGPKGVPYK